MSIRFYFDEDIPVPLARAMKQRGADVLTTQEADMESSSNDAQVAFAAGQQRVLLTHNKRDFILIHQRYLGEGKDHWGMVVADHDRVSGISCAGSPSAGLPCLPKR